LSTEAPVFEINPLEKQAWFLCQALKGKALPTKMPAAEKKTLEELLLAFRNAQKAKLLHLCTPFYTLLLNSETILASYQLLVSLNSQGNSDFQIIMDSLSENYDSDQILVSQNTTPQALNNALSILLLAITRSDKNSISYTRFDKETGKPRPTSFPLSEKLIGNFVQAFGVEYLPVIQRVLVFNKGQVLGNPAGHVEYLYQERKKAFEAEKKAWEEAQRGLARVTPAPPQIAPKVSARQAASSVSQEVTGLIKSMVDPLEKAAVIQSFQAKPLLEMLDSVNAEKDFGKKLEKIYAQKLSQSQASLLAARLSSQMKRSLLKMDAWKEDYWSEFQLLMQKAGIWEGSEWLEKWRSHKEGKQVSAKKGQAYLIEEKSDPLAEMLAKEAQLEDKRRGRKMLNQEEPEDISAWIDAATSKASAEEQKVLQALARKDRFQEFAILAAGQDLWECISQSDQRQLSDIFALYSHLDMPTIKSQILAQIAADAEATKQVLIAIELLVVKMATLFKREHQMTFVQAMEQFQRQKQVGLERDRLNSKEFQSSAAGQYSKYT
jgi:hypothetical protein